MRSSSISTSITIKTKREYSVSGVHTREKGKIASIRNKSGYGGWADKKKKMMEDIFMNYSQIQEKHSDNSEEVKGSWLYQTFITPLPSFFIR